MILEIRVLRDHVAQWVLLDPPESLAGGDALVRMVPEACQGRLAPRETVGSTVSLGCLVRKDIEVKQDPKDPQAQRERMERGETMERSGPGVCLANLDPAVC